MTVNKAYTVTDIQQLCKSRHGSQRLCSWATLCTHFNAGCSDCWKKVSPPELRKPAHGGNRAQTGDLCHGRLCCAVHNFRCWTWMTSASRNLKNYLTLDPLCPTRVFASQRLMGNKCQECISVTRMSLVFHSSTILPVKFQEHLEMCLFHHNPYYSSPIVCNSISA